MEQEEHLERASEIHRPAKLQEHMEAVGGQRLNDVPGERTRGVYYEAAHRKVHPDRWHIRRHLKRKHLELSNMHYAVVDRAGAQVLLFTTLATLATLIVIGGIFAGFTAVAAATQQRYQPQGLTLQDILPKDSLKMYDMHGTLIYQMLDAGMQTTVPLAQISRNLVNAEVAIEDQYFGTDPGYDITGMVRAAIANLSNGHIVAGGSTITQQLIKNVIVGNQDTVLSKLQQDILAPQA